MITAKEAEANKGIVLDGFVSSWYEDINLQSFVQDLKTFEDDEVDVFINSGGGVVYEGIAISNYIKSSPKKINTHVIGFAGSIASIIAISGAKTSISEGSFLFIHNASGGVWGESKDLRKEADVLDKIDATLTELYLGVITANGKLIDGSKTKTKNQIKKWQEEETYFTAKEAVKYGFIQEYKEFTGASMPEASKKISLDILNKTKAPKLVIDNYKNQLQMSHKVTEEQAKTAWQKLASFFTSNTSEAKEPEHTIEKEEATKANPENNAEAFAEMAQQIAALKETQAAQAAKNQEQEEKIKALNEQLTKAKAAPLTGDGLKGGQSSPKNAIISRLTTDLFG